MLGTNEAVFTVWNVFCLFLQFELRQSSGDVDEFLLQSGRGEEIQADEQN